MGFRDNWRGSKELELDTSDEAAKLYDAVVTQFCGWYEDDSLGGIRGCLDRMLEADPQFLLGRALNLELELLGGMKSAKVDKDLTKRIQELNQLSEKKDSVGMLSNRELLHVQVVNHWAENDGKKARNTLEDLVTEYPWDIAALKMNQDNYFSLGTAPPMRNYLSYALRMLEAHPKHRLDPNIGYVYGMYSFALEESNEYELAQENALKALQENPRDTWAVHNYAHCLEMQGKSEEGLKWMELKKDDWIKCQTLACHQYWHTALFMINQDQFKEVGALVEDEIIPRCSSSSSCLDFHDAASIIYRLELVEFFDLVGYGEGKPWSCVFDIARAHQHDHLSGFNDVHYMMGLLYANRGWAYEFLESARKQKANPLYREVVIPLLEAMWWYHAGQYSKSANLLEEIRHDIVRIGGSHAQRDVFEQLLTVAAGRSQLPVHTRLRNRSIEERDARFGRNKQTELLINATDLSYQLIWTGMKPKRYR